jgi:transmembrane protein
MKIFRRIATMPQVAFAGRVLLTMPFWLSGLVKAMDFEGATAEMNSFGLSPAEHVAAAVIVVQLGGSASVIFNSHTWLGAYALGVFTLLANFVAHRFWEIDDPVARFHDMAQFITNVAMIGGFILAAALAERRRV